MMSLRNCKTFCNLHAYANINLTFSRRYIYRDQVTGSADPEMGLRAEPCLRHEDIVTSRARDGDIRTRRHEPGGDTASYLDRHRAVTP